MNEPLAVVWPLPVGKSVFELSPLNEPLEFVEPPLDSVNRRKSRVPLPEPTVPTGTGTTFVLVMIPADAGRGAKFDTPMPTIRKPTTAKPLPQNRDRMISPDQPASPSARSRHVHQEMRDPESAILPAAPYRIASRPRRRGRNCQNAARPTAIVGRADATTCPSC